MKEKQGLMA
jgi:hypothetical protein